MHAEPQREHRWLDRLIGEWTMQSECMMGPDQPPMTTEGVEVVRSLGGLWTIAEGEGEMPGSGSMKSVMTLGYDPATGRYVGTFVASVMTHLWAYNGTLDADERVLTLDTTGPGFNGEPSAPYKDSIEFVDDDHRTLNSCYQGADGQWTTFMTAHYRRKK